MKAEKRKPLGAEVLDVTYAFSEERFGILERPPSALPRPGILTRTIAMCVRWGRAQYHAFKYRQARCRKGGIIFFANTRNQYDAIAPVAALLPKARIVGEFGIGEELFPTPSAYRQSMGWILPVLLGALSASGYLRRSLRYFFDQFVLAHGYLDAARQWLKEVAPDVIVVANDHNPQHRAILRVAREVGVPTVYLQHAAVTYRFPPLLVDVALLDGMDAVEKYSRCGPSTAQVYLTGSPKADMLFEKSSSKDGSAIGICTNRLDPPRSVEEVINRLQDALPGTEIVLRTHPADTRTAEWSAVAARTGILIGPSDQSIHDFLAGVVAVVAGGSSVLLEAALSGTLAISYSFDPRFGDVYGFASAGVVKPAEGVDELVRLIRERDLREAISPEALRRFHATYGTSLHGQSARLAADLITQVAAGEAGPYRGWEPVEDVALRTFSPVFEPSDHTALKSVGKAFHAEGV